jgi:serine/threonine-protein kinase
MTGDRDDSSGPPLVLPGALIGGKYRVLDFLAEGGMGAVVRARHEVLQQDVAIKLMKRELAEDGASAQRFLREARAAARIASDYVAKVTDVDLLEDGTPYMVMELLEGRDLAARLAVGDQLPIREAVDYTLQALAGVEAAHAIGVVHRDLKPSNLFLVTRSDGVRVKVLDFGISKVLEEHAPASLKLAQTTGQVVMGTPRFMSPEQFASTRDVDLRTDLWAMGLILYEMLTQSYPFDGETPGAILTKILSSAPPPVRKLRFDAPMELDRAVMRCLERDREKRFPSARELMRAIAPYASRRVQALLFDHDPHAPVFEAERELAAAATTVAVGAATPSPETQTPSRVMRPATAPTVLERTPATGSVASLAPAKDDRSALVRAAVAAVGVVLIVGVGVALKVRADAAPASAPAGVAHAAVVVPSTTAAALAEPSATASARATPPDVAVAPGASSPELPVAPAASAPAVTPVPAADSAAAAGSARPTSARSPGPLPTPAPGVKSPAKASSPHGGDDILGTRD